MRSSARVEPRRRGGNLPAAALFVSLAPGSAVGFPDGAPWGTGIAAEGCNRCHFDSPVRKESEALELAGLPAEPAPGRSYRLTLSICADTMAAAGFLLTVSADGEAAGSLNSLDERTESRAAQARSTRAGTALTGKPCIAWTLDWIAPATIGRWIRFDAWGIAANDDQSPLADLTFSRSWIVDQFEFDR